MASGPEKKAFLARISLVGSTQQSLRAGLTRLIRARNAFFYGPLAIVLFRPYLKVRTTEPVDSDLAQLARMF